MKNRFFNGKDVLLLKVLPIMLLLFLLSTPFRPEAIGVELSGETTYIIELEDWVSAQDCANDLAISLPGLTVKSILTDAINAIVVDISVGTEEELNTILYAISNDYRVKNVEPDQVVAPPELVEAPGFIFFFKPRFEISKQMVPTGVDRVDGDLNPYTGKGVNFLLIDSGFPPNHPDWPTPIGAVDFLTTPDPGAAIGEDMHGHGTLTGGVMLAQDNDFGLVGISPDVNLWIAKVFSAQGLGTVINGIKALNWAAATHSDDDLTNDVKLILFEMAPNSPHPPLCSAITNLAQLGVTVVAPSGNSGLVARGCSETIKVSGIVDSDGLPGGTGSDFSIPILDDTYMKGSNYGSAITVAAPSYQIFSTSLRVGYNGASGTSMAGPHVAGAVALYLEAYPYATPYEVKQAILDGAFAQDGPNGFTPVEYLTGSGDFRGFGEPVLNANALSMGGRPLNVFLDDIRADDIFVGEAYTIKARPHNIEETGIGVTLTAEVSGNGFTQTLTSRSAGLKGGEKGKMIFDDISTLPAGSYVVVITLEETGEQDVVLFTIY